MAHRADAAELADAMAKKWVVDVIYGLADGPQRYNALLKGLSDNVTPKVFTRVLRRLEADNIIERHVLDRSPPSVVYQITEFGSSLLVKLDDMAELWVRRHVKSSSSPPIPSLTDVSVHAFPQ